MAKAAPGSPPARERGPQPYHAGTELRQPPGGLALNAGKEGSPAAACAEEPRSPASWPRTPGDRTRARSKPLSPWPLVRQPQAPPRSARDRDWGGAEQRLLGALWLDPRGGPGGVSSTNASPSRTPFGLCSLLSVTYV